MNEKEMEEARRVARLMAGFIAQRLTEQEAGELEEWIEENDENALLFEKLTARKNIDWAMAWFRDLGMVPDLKNREGRIS